MQAELSYLKATSLHDKAVEAWQGLSELYHATQQWSKAVDADQQLVSGQPLMERGLRWQGVQQSGWVCVLGGGEGGGVGTVCLGRGGLAGYEAECWGGLGTVSRQWMQTSSC